MSQSRLAAIAVLGIVTVTAIGFAISQYRRAEALTEQLALSLAANDLAAATRAKSSAPTSRASDPTPPAESSGEATAVEEDTPPDDLRPGNRPPRGRGGNMEERFATMMQNPEFAAAIRTQQLSALDGRYADLFRKLNLSPAALAQLKNLLAEKQNVARDVLSAARSEGLSGRESRDEVRALVESSQAEVDAEIRATIGDSAFQALQSYDSTTAQREMVSQIENRLSYSSAPLNDAQADALVTILAETAPASGQNNRLAFALGGPGGNFGGTVITDETIARAQGVLSSTQLQSLVDIQSEQKAQQTIGALMRDQMQAERAARQQTGTTAAVNSGNGGGGD